MPVQLQHACLGSDGHPHFIRYHEPTGARKMLLMQELLDQNP